MDQIPSSTFLQQNKRAIIFLCWFLGVYVTGNLIYGLYIQSQYPKPDIFTALVAKNIALILNSLGYDVTAVVNPIGPTYLLKQRGQTILSVYEGCNAINVMIVFVAFILAFGGPLKKMKPYVPFGLLILYIANLLRIGLLFWVAQHYQLYFYYLHKYIFTAMIYAVVLVLWGVWIKMAVKQPESFHA